VKLLERRVLEALAAGAYAFVDAGCGDGGSIDHCARRFGASPGLGLDYNRADVEAAVAKGYDAHWCDIRYEDLPSKCVRYAAMMDFLEHLPDEAAAVLVLEKLAAAARDFLFIRHPSFEDVEYMAGLGVKFGWTDWSGHTNMMRIADFERVFAAFGWKEYVVLPHLPYLDASHESIVPVTAPTDSYLHDDARYGPKPRVRFDRTLYGRFDIFVRLNPAMPEAEWRRLASVEGWEAHYD
jgi:trans-aconitate methyltransferase